MNKKSRKFSADRKIIIIIPAQVHFWGITKESKNLVRDNSCKRGRKRYEESTEILILLNERELSLTKRVKYKNRILLTEIFGFLAGESCFSLTGLYQRPRRLLCRQTVQILSKRVHCRRCPDNVRLQPDFLHR